MYKRVLYFFASVFFTVVDKGSAENLNFARDLLPCVEGYLHTFHPESPLGPIVQHLASLLSNELLPPRLKAASALSYVQSVFRENEWHYNLTQGSVRNQKDFFEEGMIQMVSALVYLKGETQAVTEVIQASEDEAGSGSFSSSFSWKIPFANGQQAYDFLYQYCPLVNE